MVMLYLLGVRLIKLLPATIKSLDPEQRTALRRLPPYEAAIRFAACLARIWSGK
jgi:hypothetical protein